MKRNYSRNCSCVPHMHHSHDPLSGKIACAQITNHGGNTTPQYSSSPGLGVWGCTELGLWEDRSATSFAAPVLAGKAALVLSALQKICEQGARPFAATAKAYLALTASHGHLAPTVEPLASRRLGRGQASPASLTAPIPETGVLIWQGVIEASNDIVRVQLPIPRRWLRDATDPRLKVVVAWDAPVNSAAPDVWASRAVRFHLRPHPDARALHPTGRTHPSLPSS
jgi:hypothetical protein